MAVQSLFLAGACAASRGAPPAMLAAALAAFAFATRYLLFGAAPPELLAGLQVASTALSIFSLVPQIWMNFRRKSGAAAARTRYGFEMRCAVFGADRGDAAGRDVDIPRPRAVPPRPPPIRVAAAALPPRRRSDVRPRGEPGTRAGGQWSAITAGLSCAGQAARVFTTLQLTKDAILFVGFFTGFLFNAILLSQILLY